MKWWRKLFRFLKKFWKNEKGWTFVETLIAITIGLMLTAMVGITAFKQVGRARIMKAQTEIENTSLAITTYYLDCGTYPSEQQGLDALWEKPGSNPVPENWDGPYLSRAVKEDPWGNEYIYQNPGPAGQPYGIHSLGSDGMEGGDGEAADIKSWE